MIVNMKKIVYKAFGFHIASEIDLPEIPKIKLENENVDIIVKLDDLTMKWEEEAEANSYFHIKENHCMCKIPDVGIFLIQDGNKIFVSPLEDACEDEIRLYLLGTCMGAILMQRRILPLHGSAIAIDGNAYAIVGDSGAGKSTLAAAFLDRGYSLLSDDVIPVTLTPDQIPVVTPAYPQQKLWIESLRQLGMNSANLQPLVARETKFAVPVAANFINEQMRLAGIFELGKAEDQKISIQTIKNLERFPVLYHHTYRNFFISDSGLIDWHFRTSAKIVKKIDFYELRRPTSRFTAHELVDLIIKTTKKEEKIYESI